MAASSTAEIDGTFMYLAEIEIEALLLRGAIMIPIAIVSLFLINLHAPSVYISKLVSLLLKRRCSIELISNFSSSGN